jgi:hypothetical protein
MVTTIIMTMGPKVDACAAAHGVIKVDFLTPRMRDSVDLVTNSRAPGIVTVPTFETID